MSLEAIYRRAPAPLQTFFLNAAASGIWLHRYGLRYERTVRRIVARDRWPRERVGEFQDREIRSMVAYAYAKSMYYRRLLENVDVRPQDIDGRSALSALPLLTKELLRENLSEILTATVPRRGWLHGHTSGTTGSPLSLWYDRSTAVLNNAVDRRQKIWAGVGDKDWIGLLLGRVVVSPERERPPFWKANHMLRQLWLSTFHLTVEHFPAYVAEIRRRGLRYLEGYPSTLFILARYLLDSGQRLPMRAVFTSSETLHDIQREAIETAFECRIYDFYGHAERVIFAIECGVPGGKHLAEEYGFTEVVDHRGDPVAPGETGYLVGTSLSNRAMPMIRYRTGDLSRIIEEPCECGRTSRRIASVSTKAEDIVVTPDGRLLSPSILTHPFKPFPEITKSQIVQESIERIRVKLVVDASWTDGKEQQLRQALEERLGSGVNVDLHRVDEIPTEPSGKFRWVVSNVEHTARVTW